ncbi:MAG: ArsR/SmtB family transcription factor [Elusimicrobiota bacterium]
MTGIYFTTQADLVFKALADPGRRRLLDRLRIRGGRTLVELCEGMNMSRQAVAKHLGQLDAAGLVETRWSGREKLHYLNPVLIHEVYARWVGKFERARNSRGTGRNWNTVLKLLALSMAIGK